MKSFITKITPESLAFIIIIAFLAVLPMTGLPHAWTLYGFTFAIFLAMATMWNLIAGYSGLISLCQPAFVGLGGYALALMAWVNVPWWLGLIGALVLAGIFAAILAFGVFRLSGVYFAIGTLVIPEALRQIAYIWNPVGGTLVGKGAGYTIKNISEVTAAERYWLALVVAIIAVIILRLVLRSGLGLGLAAIRDNQRAAAASGVNTFIMKMYPFVIGAAVTGLAGAIFYMSQGYIAPSKAFSIDWTMTILLAAVIGGLRTEGGPIIGSLIFVFLYYLLANYGSYSLLIEGVILVVIMLLSPQGLIGLAKKSRVYHQIGNFFTQPLLLRSGLKPKTDNR